MTELIQQTGEALIALAKGEKVQYYDVTSKTWRDTDAVEEMTKCKDFDLSHILKVIYRIKPEPKMRLITQDELPPIFWVMTPGDYTGKACQTWNLCLGISSDGFLWLPGKGGTNFHIGALADEGKMWSPDRRNPQSFLVEDKE